MTPFNNLISEFKAAQEIKNIADGNERMIYIMRYAAAVVAAVAAVFMIGLGTSGAGHLGRVADGRYESDFNAKLKSDVAGLESNESRINAVLRRIEAMKYPTRDTLRADVNDDFAAAGLEVVSFAPVERQAELERKGGRQKTARNTGGVMSDLIEAEVTGRIKTERLLDLISMFDRKDRFWYLSSMTATAPEGAENFFGAAYPTLDRARREELFRLYEQDGGRDYVRVAFNLRTFVRQ